MLLKKALLGIGALVVALATAGTASAKGFPPGPGGFGPGMSAGVGYGGAGFRFNGGYGYRGGRCNPWGPRCWNSGYGRYNCWNPCYQRYNNCYPRRPGCFPSGRPMPY